MIEFAVWVYFGFRSLLCRPLPVDIGRCTCVIVKEASPEGLNGGTLYSLYTNVRSLLFMFGFIGFSWDMFVGVILKITQFFSGKYSSN